MTGFEKDRFNFRDSDGLLGGVASEMRRLERERASLFSAASEYGNAAAHFGKLFGVSDIAAVWAKQSSFHGTNSAVARIAARFNENTAATGLLKQLTDAGKAQQESIRRMLDPMRDIRDSFRIDSRIQRALDEFKKPFSFGENSRNVFANSSAYDETIKRISSISEHSMLSTRGLLNDDLFNTGIERALRSFESISDKWVVPNPLLESLGSMRALEERFGKVTLPVIDAASAATLARMLGLEGVKAQLAAFSDENDEQINVAAPSQHAAFKRRGGEIQLKDLLNLVLVVVILWYQEQSSSRWQDATDQALAVQSKKTDALASNQTKMIEALNVLVEKVLVDEAKRNEERFVVRERIAEVRSKPENGSSVEGKLLPREVVLTVSEKGKWIEIEYYHWLLREYRTGWALKKYFTRVPSNFDEPRK
ncbi:MAG: hypothetical protein EAZ43_16440 [Betaproteobacteria bacterium]|nr:MAG: hypothetical protein EAZ43_16440 [Betaproteobacteria bacterium]